MIEIICFLFPGVASAYFAWSLMERTRINRSFCFLVVTNTILTTLVTLIIKVYLFAAPLLQFHSDEGINVESVLKYMVLAIAVALSISVIEAFAGKWFSVKLDEKKQKEEGIKE